MGVRVKVKRLAITSVSIDVRATTRYQDLCMANLDLPRRIHLWRKAKSLTQLQLAERCEVHQTAVSQWENGTASPSQSNLQAVAKACNVTMAEFYGPIPKS